jgi:Uncharacterized conserved protein
MRTEEQSFQLMDEDELSLALINAQYDLRKTQGQKNGKSLIVLVNGIELAGKGEAVKQLREWVDPRYLQVKADQPQVLGEKQTFWQPYTRFIPAQGQIMVYLATGTAICSEPPCRLVPLMMPSLMPIWKICVSLSRI